MANLNGAGAPTKYTIGAVGDIYTNLNNGIRYECVTVISVITNKGSTTKYEWDQIIECQSEGGSGSDDDSTTYLLIDEDGNEFPAVLVDERVIFTATPNDIRLGSVAATEDGVVTGEKVIPSYHTNQGTKFIPIGSSLKITSLEDQDAYSFTKLQVIVCDFNTTLSNSVSANKVVIDDNLYTVQSTVPLSVVTKNSSDKTIELGIINDTDKPLILRFFTYKEIE